MLDVFILSLVQSITEFLPISSSGHLLLLNKLGFSDQTLGMDVLLHLGTLLAVMVYFKKDVLNLIQVLWGRGDKYLFGKLVLATLPSIVVGFFFFNLIEHCFRSPYLVAINSIYWGIILWGMDKYSPKTNTIEKLSFKGAFYIGCLQSLALIPGTSRSGITMTCGRALGINRPESARFSMLLSIPTILMTVGYIFIKGIRGEVQLPSFPMGLWGVWWAFILGISVVYFLMKWVKTFSFGLFALYRILLGVGVLLYLIF